MKKLKLEDEVKIIAGKDKGKTGLVFKIYEKQNRVLVKGVNLFKKSIKPTQNNPAGGFAEVERPIHRSNVMVVSPKTKARTRIKIENKDGKNIRVAKTCNSTL